MIRKTRLAIVASHPIPYYTPLYRAVARAGVIHVRAFFGSRIGLDKILDPSGMGVEIAWKTDLLAGYEHEFLPRAERVKTTRWHSVNNPGVGAALQRFCPDVVLLSGYTLVTMQRALAWCRGHGVPAMMISDSSLHSATGIIMRTLKAGILPTIFRQFSAFLCIGDANERYYATFGVPARRLFRVPILIDEGFWAYRIRHESTRAAMRSKLRLREDDLAVLFVGKLIARKRPGDLLAALKRLRTLPPTPKRVKILFVGDGEQRAELEQAARRSRLAAHFLGFINIDMLPAYYCAADVLAHPAEVETFGMIVLEAAILGLPLVLSDKVGAVGPTSAARPGENALIHPCGDVAALADLLARLASEPETLMLLAQASRQVAAEHDGHVSVAGMHEAVRYCLQKLPAVHSEPNPT